jgi:hypothetical protein
MISNILAVVGLLAATAHGHISLAEPVPYGHPDTSPLDASGANYPCKTDNGFSYTKVNDLAVGQAFPVSFSGSAVHGGGSCQLSLTPTMKPDTNSVFRVIYSIEGGCPGTDGSTVSYSVKVPAEVPNGNYSLAWSWANKIGNREYYMNCAPVSITGSTQKDDTAFNGLPEMAIFNIPTKSACTTLETFDVQYFDPGNYKEVGSAFAPHAPANCGSGNASTPSTSASGSSGNSGQYTPAASAQTGSASTSGSSGNNGQYSANSGQYTSPAGSSQTGSAGNSGQNSANSGQYTSGSAASAETASPDAQSGSSQGSASASPAYANSTSPTSGSAPTTIQTSVLFPSSSSSAAASAAPVASSGTGGGSAASAAPAVSPASGSVACSTNGAVVCDASGKYFGLCNFGTAVMQAVAPGTACVAGKIDYAVPPGAKFRARL